MLQTRWEEEKWKEGRKEGLVAKKGGGGEWRPQFGDGEGAGREKGPVAGKKEGKGTIERHTTSTVPSSFLPSFRSSLGVLLPFSFPFRPPLPSGSRSDWVRFGERGREKEANQFCPHSSSSSSAPHRRRVLFPSPPLFKPSPPPAVPPLPSLRLFLGSFLLLTWLLLLLDSVASLSLSLSTPHTHTHTLLSL